MFPFGDLQQAPNTAEAAGIVRTDLFSLEMFDVFRSLAITFTSRGVIMEVTQEVSEAVNQGTSKIEEDTPTIQTRNIESTVAVQSGQSVVLGGLIRDKQEEGQSGVPGLYSLPVVGALFGSTDNSKLRTELVVVLTPRVIANAADARKITEDFRSNMKGLQGSF